ncbi:MAG TPA: LysR substrate-binding domain-containing protein [Candidatus Competibacteraceae bacterium]|nr:LysR substrate-binding domain-containing protein [Candidatus Competibacteraceae bacterium]
MPPPHYLVVFEAVARHLSLTRAARELGTTQPAVSHQIRQLERHLDAQLFYRAHRGVTLTDHGRRLYEAVQRGFGTILEALTEIRRPAAPGTLNVATDFGFAAFWLLPRLPAFRARYPDIDVRVITAQRAFDIATESIDIAIVFGRPPFPQAIAKPLCSEEVFAVCSPRLLAERPIRRLEDLRDCPLLQLGSEEETRWYTWSSWFRACGAPLVPRGPMLSFDNYILLIQAAIAGQGVALGWSLLVDELLRVGQLVRALEVSVSSERGYYVLLPEARRVSAAAFPFRQWLLQELEEGRC